MSIARTEHREAVGKMLSDWNKAVLLGYNDYTVTTVEGLKSKIKELKGKLPAEMGMVIDTIVKGMECARLVGILTDSNVNAAAGPDDIRVLFRQAAPEKGLDRLYTGGGFTYY